MRPRQPIRFFALLLCLCAPAARAEDAEVARGIHEVEQGDYDGAIVTLDAAARRPFVLNYSGKTAPEPFTLTVRYP